MEYLLYALPAGVTARYMEDLITCKPSRAELEPARTWAETQGFHSFRIATFNPGMRPDFAASIDL